MRIFIFNYLEHHIKPYNLMQNLEIVIWHLLRYVSLNFHSLVSKTKKSTERTKKIPHKDENFKPNKKFIYAKAKPIGITLFEGLFHFAEGLSFCLRGFYNAKDPLINCKRPLHSQIMWKTLWLTPLLVF